MSKRSNHEGSINKYGNRYRVQLMIEGKRVQKYADTRKEAAEILDDLRMEYRETGRVIKRDIKLQELAAKWIDDKKTNWSSSTVEHYWNPFKLHLLPLLADKPISKINDPIFLNDLFNKELPGVSTYGIKQAHKALSNCFEWAVGRKLLTSNMCKGGRQGYFSLPKHEKKSKPELTPVELDLLKEAIAGSKQVTLFTLLAASGMRVSEALGLSEADINMNDNTLTIRHQLKIENGIRYLDKTKSRNTRVIQVGQSIIDMLLIKMGNNEKLRSELEDRQIEWQPSVSCNCCSNKSFQMVFLTQAGSPLDYHNLRSRDWSKMISSSSINVSLTLHDLRHIYASTALVKGYDVVTVSKHLGHANPSITLEIYAQYIKPPNQREMAEEIAEIFTR